MSILKKVLRVTALVFPVFAAAMHSATAIANEYEVYADNIFGVEKIPVKDETSSSIPTESSSQEEVELVDMYQKMYEKNDDYVDYREDVMKRIAEEGSVLLKNNNKTLPISGEGKKISLFGNASHYSQLGGNISAFVQTNPANCVSLEKALKQYYTLNEDLISFYASNDNKRGASPSSSFNTGEVAINPTLRSSYTSFNDAAICVIARANAEEADYFPNGSVTDTSGDTSNKGLSLSKLEKEMIEEAANNFDKVVIIINSAIPVEIDQYKNDDRIGAILWVGLPGSTGFRGVANIIHGDVSPSGALSDTFAVSLSNAPAAKNFAAYTFSNTASMVSSDFRKYADSYLMQAEGIYVGYKYYETRYYDAVNDPTGTNAKSTAGSLSGEWNYNKEVSYPFGYGLSYTTFSEEFVDKDGNPATTISFDEKGMGKAYVKVKNTGEVQGKHAVKMFYQSPYSDLNKTNGVEKSAVSLISYAKTGLLAPNNEEIIELDFDMQYMASYDRNVTYDGKKGAYIFDVGDYYFSLGNGSHEAVNNILVKQGKTAVEGVDYIDENAAKKVIKMNLGTDSGNGYDYRFTISKAGERISNQFEDADYNYFVNDKVTYLTRKDWTTFPMTYSTGISITSEMVPYLTNTRYTLKTGEDTSSVVWGKSGELTLQEMYGKDFDDPMWNSLISQLSLEDAVALLIKYNGGLDFSTSIGLSRWKVLDGPIGMMININTETKGSYALSSMPCEPLVAATYNHELQLEEGKCFGQDSLINGYETFFAPGLNVHRTAFCGRNHEYYSEDSMLCNYVGTNVTKGTRMYGCLTIMKHFAFNDIEAKRQGIAEFMNEQAVRENELRAFQGPCEANYAGGVMASYSRIGLKPGSANDSLETVLRKEWKFKGIEISDAAFRSYTPYLDWIDSLAHGGVQLLASSAIWASKTVAGQIKGDIYLMNKLVDVVHYHLYTYLNSNKFNFKVKKNVNPDPSEGDDPVIIPIDNDKYILVRPWKTGLEVVRWTLTGVAAIAFLAYVAYEITSDRKNKVGA